MNLLLQSLVLLCMLIISAAMAWSTEHPRLIVCAEMYLELRARATRAPWNKIKESVEQSTELVYRADGSYYEQLFSMGKIMRQGALAYILFPGTDITFIAGAGMAQVLLNGTEALVVARSADRVTVHVPAGEHQVEISRTAGAE